MVHNCLASFIFHPIGLPLVVLIWNLAKNRVKAEFQFVMDWQSWCRLCGNFETILKIEPEIQEVALKLVNVFFWKIFAGSEIYANSFVLGN